MAHREKYTWTFATNGIPIKKMHQKTITITEGYPTYHLAYPYTSTKPSRRSTTPGEPRIHRDKMHLDIHQWYTQPGKKTLQSMDNQSCRDKMYPG